MKRIKRFFAIVLVIAMSALMLAIPASAKSITELQKSVVCIGATVQFTSSNYDTSFSFSSSGTGFAVGTPGKPVQYIATCAHVVSEPSGIYTLYYEEETGTIIDFVKESEGTAYPVSDEGYYGDKYCIAIRDYFTTQTVDLYAIFSGSSNDYINLTVAQINSDFDLAVCKLASEPTNRLNALPLQLKSDVEVNTDIIAIGFPGISRYASAENRLDYTDSTVKDGIVSNMQRTSSGDAMTTYDVFEVSAELSGGMSGGPVISEESGAIIGVSAFLYSDASQAATARYAVCIDYLTEMLDRESIPYEIYGSDSISPVMIILILVAVVLIIAVIVVIALLSKKKPAPVNEPSTIAEPSAPVKKYYLIGVSGPLSGKKFGITNSAIIGRDSSKCNVLFSVDQPGVSGVHCEVKISGDVLTLKDCGSSYGTFLDNGTKLEPNISIVLPSGSRFCVGSKANVFEVKY